MKNSLIKIIYQIDIRLSNGILNRFLLQRQYKKSLCSLSLLQWTKLEVSLGRRRDFQPLLAPLHSRSHGNNTSQKSRAFEKIWSHGILMSGILAWMYPRKAEDEKDKKSKDLDPKIITDKELDGYEDELMHLNVENRWETVMKSHCMDGKKELWTMQIWKNPVSQDSTLQQYKVCGKFYKMSPDIFMKMLSDVMYRKEWDKFALFIEILKRESESEKENNTLSEVLHWVQKFPLPHYNREYTFVRRFRKDMERNMMTIACRSSSYTDPLEEDDEEIIEPRVKVENYSCIMLIKPHTQFDQPGFDIIMLYTEDPKCIIHQQQIKHIFEEGLPRFLEKFTSSSYRFPKGLRGYRSMKQKDRREELFNAANLPKYQNPYFKVSKRDPRALAIMLEKQFGKGESDSK